MAGFSPRKSEFASVTVSEWFVMDRESFGEPFSKSFRLILSYNPIIFRYIFTHHAGNSFSQPILKMSSYGATESRHVEKL